MKILNCIGSYVAVGLMFVFAGCVGTSPEVLEAMNKAGVTKEQICKAKGRWYSLQNGTESCSYAPSMEDIKYGLEFKEFETYCEKANGTMRFENDYFSRNKKEVSVCNVRGKQYVYNSTNQELYTYANKIEAENKKDEEYRQRQEKAYIEEIQEVEKAKEAEKRSIEASYSTAEAYRKARLEADKKEKIEADKKAKIELIEVVERLKNLGVSEKEVRAGSYTQYSKEPLTNKDVDRYLRLKQEDKKKQEFEKNAKIQEGKQYICTDGYDSWVLKYNGEMITFGEINYNRRLVLVGDYFEINEYDRNPILINREKGTMVVAGNKLICKPR